MRVNYRADVALSIPWDDDVRPLPEAPFGKLSFSGKFTTASPRLTRALHAIRVDQDRNLYLILDSPRSGKGGEPRRRLLRFDAGGTLLDRFDFAAGAQGPDASHIVDFQPDGRGGIYLLEVLETVQGELSYGVRRLNDQGHEVWRRRGALDYRVLDFGKLAGKFTRLLVGAPGSLYLLATQPQSAVAGLDANSGEIAGVYPVDEPVDTLTIGASGEAYYPRYVESETEKGFVLVKRELITGRQEIIESEIQYLHDLAGVDAAGSIYPRLHDGIARLSARGRLEWEQRVAGLVVRAGDSSIFICRRSELAGDAAVLETDQYEPSGPVKQTFVFRLPKEHLPARGGPPRLVNVDAEARFFFYGGETDDQAGTLYVYTGDGRLRDILPLADIGGDGFPVFDKVNQLLLPMESQVASPGMFEVDRSGGVYIPLSDPGAFRVIRLQPEAS